ncbi:hypothetical protein BGZ65_005466 [Modicella reniformis]|uniref:Uncharacterized protein n=1 Tax=Modicella reniformis TaxID=1440133 RepID=A0A9P6IN05_9FUNG|nr:hypothetical protein BGZ65_005466 [Modicella reniformis]
MKWLVHEDRMLYRDNRSVLLEAEKLMRVRQIPAKMALEELENIRQVAKVEIRLFAKALAYGCKATTLMLLLLPLLHIEEKEEEQEKRGKEEAQEVVVEEV